MPEPLRPEDLMESFGNDFEAVLAAAVELLVQVRSEQHKGGKVMVHRPDGTVAELRLRSDSNNGG